LEDACCLDCELLLPDDDARSNEGASSAVDVAIDTIHRDNNKRPIECRLDDIQVKVLKSEYMDATRFIMNARKFKFKILKQVADDDDDSQFQILSTDQLTK
jgi:hypothetical protein